MKEKLVGQNVNDSSLAGERGRKVESMRHALGEGFILALTEVHWSLLKQEKSSALVSNVSNSPD